MSELKLNFNVSRILVANKNLLCKIIISIDMLNYKFTIPCIFIEKYTTQIIILHNGNNKEIYNWNVFKMNLLNFLDSCYNKIYNNYKDSFIILIDNKIINNNKLYFETYHNKIGIVHNDVKSYVNLTYEHLQELHKIITHIENPMNYINNF